ncbi:hypothetical protein MYSTI_06104 [Myxococcus stipitatus DSM 14675]|uniref:Uncharacterized protein n=1 Tax=Myxococcus stipitatus (strain DSM 14675 / JCM 12634 / Mx s8) TaxID=1278073 RepID=L7UIK6_MYXSD|nr:hypothetical protein [Myxococcus stipitatus]AGC47377.1 hypothetical protein MYSTI_06104 [Myxococcus stipitatus DSM 14675]
MARCRPSVSRASSATFTFLERSAVGVLRKEVLELILDFGQRIRAAGATHITVLERDLPEHLRGTTLARQARGWIVLVSDEERLLTCYRRGDASGFIRRKPKHRLHVGRPHLRVRRPRGGRSDSYQAR